MKEINSHNLNSAIAMLPQHEAAEWVWEEINWQVNQPLVAPLPMHTAPASAWSAIATGAGISGIGSLTRSLSLVVASLMLTLVFSINTGSKYNPYRISSQTPSKYSGQQTLKIQHDAAPIACENQEVSNKIPANQVSIYKKNKPFVTHNDNFELPVALAYNTNLHHSLQISAVHFLKAGQIANTLAPVPIERKQYYEQCSEFNHRETPFVLFASLGNAIPETSQFAAPVSDVAVGAGIEPGRFSFYAGIGTIRFRNNSPVDYHFRKNELIHSYDYVDSVYIDPITHETTYFTVLVDVYDSIDYTYTETMHERNSYLKVPFAFGCRIAGSNNITVNLLLEGTYYTMHSDSRSVQSFNQADSRLVHTIYNRKAYPAAFWGAGVSADVRYHFSNNWDLSVAPFFRWYRMKGKDSDFSNSGSPGINFTVYCKINQR